MGKDNMNQNNTEQSNTSSNNKKPLYKKPWFIAIICIFGVSIIHAAVTNSDTKSVDNSSAVAVANTESKTEALTEEKPEKVTEKLTEEPTTEPPTEPETEKPTDKSDESSNKKEDEDDSEDDEGFIDGAKKFLFGEGEEDGAIDNIKDKAKEYGNKVVDKAKDFLADEEIEVTTPDEFMLDGKLYSINELTVDDAKELVTDAKEKKDSNGNLISLQNDNIVIEFDSYSGEVLIVSFLSSGNKVYNDIEVGMKKDDIINRIDFLSISDKQLMCSLNDEGQWVLNDKDASSVIMVTLNFFNRVESISIGGNRLGRHLYASSGGVLKDETIESYE